MRWTAIVLTLPGVSSLVVPALTVSPKVMACRTPRAFPAQDEIAIIKRRFKALAHAFHPDRNGAHDAQEQFQALASEHKQRLADCKLFHEHVELRATWALYGGAVTMAAQAFSTHHHFDLISLSTLVSASGLLGAGANRHVATLNAAHAKNCQRMRNAFEAGDAALRSLALAQQEVWRLAIRLEEERAAEGRAAAVEAEAVASYTHAAKAARACPDDLLLKDQHLNGSDQPPSLSSRSPTPSVLSKVPPFPRQRLITN
eukprot:CAMPEP_0174756140 /NCGR_PEP_ID=MMETSP1094-20130205/106607_1 /TAXON_ID=156173 /ORGANISM="Chrysochromulina brevifilum, Strain UTEX LB 985" /LENGTH=257 /DNA_ID=CAMNT_0015962047 /DNA_START=87 /DNA_END=860 /DNA_ORIENTATION=-